MPAEYGEFYKLTKEDIVADFETAFEEKLDNTLEPGDLAKKQLEAEAETLVQNQEEALQRVYYAGYLEDATGVELEKIVQLIGLSRLEATSATGVVKFQRETPATATYPVQRGVVVQVEGQSPLRFSTTEQSKIPYIDGWESNDLRHWIGDTGSFNVVSTSDLTNSYALEVPATSGVQILVDGGSYGIGTTFNVDILPSSGSITEFKFGYQDSSNYHKAIIDTSTGELSLETVEDGSVISNNTSSVSIPTGTTSHVEIDWTLHGDNGLRLFESEYKDTEIGSVFLDQSPLWSEGNVTIRSGDSTAVCLVDEFAGTACVANIEAVGEGVNTNIGPHQISVISSSVSGVEDVTNKIPTGDESHLKTDLSTCRIGEPRETDEELRERAFENTSIGGAATVKALETEVQRVDGVQSLTLYQNKKGDPVDGLPAHSFELIVYGGSDSDIANAIFDSVSIDSQDVGGVNGTEVTYDVISNILNSAETIHFSRPTEKNLDITLDLIVDNNYIGDEETRSIVVNYIGGTAMDGTNVPGLDVGDDVYEAVLKNKIVDPHDTGIWEVDSITIDGNNDGTDDTTTTESGADVYSVSNSSVVETNARDGSITINTTLK